MILLLTGESWQGILCASEVITTSVRRPMLQPTLGCLAALKLLSKTMAPSWGKAQAWQPDHMAIVDKASRLKHDEDTP